MTSKSALYHSCFDKRPSHPQDATKEEEKEDKDGKKEVQPSTPRTVAWSVGKGGDTEVMEKKIETTISSWGIDRENGKEKLFC